MAHIQKRRYRTRDGKETVSWQARYNGPDGKEHSRRFRRQADAQAWLDHSSSEIVNGGWVDPRAGMVLFEDYAADCLTGRRLRPTTRSKYEYLLKDYLLPAFGETSVVKITPSMVRAWHATLNQKHAATAAGAYRLLASIFRTAVDDEIISRTPCRLKGAGRDRSPERPIASLHEISAAVAACPTHYQAALLFAAWCQLRRGEILGLQRQDLDLDTETVTVKRAWCLQHDGRCTLGPPKTEAGIRTLRIPPNVVPAVQAHMMSVGTSPTAWLFPGEEGRPASPRTLDRVWAKTRAAIGRPDLRFHDLRHTGLTMAAATPGVSTANLMKRGGHASPAAALRYQHATTDRDEILARALGEMAESTKVSVLRRTKDGRTAPGQAGEQAS